MATMPARYFIFCEADDLAPHLERQGPETGQAAIIDSLVRANGPRHCRWSRRFGSSVQ